MAYSRAQTMYAAPQPIMPAAGAVHPTLSAGAAAQPRYMSAQAPQTMSVGHVSAAAAMPQAQRLVRMQTAGSLTDSVGSVSTAPSSQQAQHLMRMQTTESLTNSVGSIWSSPSRQQASTLTNLSRMCSSPLPVGQASTPSSVTRQVPIRQPAFPVGYTSCVASSPLPVRAPTPTMVTQQAQGRQPALPVGYIGHVASSPLPVRAPTPTMVTQQAQGRPSPLISYRTIEPGVPQQIPIASAPATASIPSKGPICATPGVRSIRRLSAPAAPVPEPTTPMREKTELKMPMSADRGTAWHADRVMADLASMDPDPEQSPGEAADEAMNTFPTSSIKNDVTADRGMEPNESTAAPSERSSRTPPMPEPADMAQPCPAADLVPCSPADDEASPDMQKAAAEPLEAAAPDVAPEVTPDVTTSTEAKDGAATAEEPVVSPTPRASNRALCVLQ